MDIDKRQKAAATRKKNEFKAWLKHRGIHPKIAELLDVAFVDGSIAYPRYDSDGNHFGWKLRNIKTGATTQKPRGVSGKDTSLLNLGLQSTGRAYLCEGETDFMTVATCIGDESIPPGRAYCVPGSTSFQPEQASQIPPSMEVILLPDGDDGGEKMVERMSPHFPGCSRVHLPEGEDVNSLVLSMGAETLAHLLAARVKVVPPKRQPKRERASERFDDDYPLGTIESLIDPVTKLKRRGSDLIAKCPFHNDSTASLMVSPKKQVAHCHGCEWSGGPAKWIMETENKTWREAKELLAQRYGTTTGQISF